jgi:periplasmic divalent cation tolerance protein
MRVSVGYITFPNQKEAREMVTALLEAGLIACANIIPGAESYFLWEDEVQKQSEYIVILKTKEENEEKIVKFVEKYHTYEVPCVVFWPLSFGSADYLKWVDKSC